MNCEEIVVGGIYEGKSKSRRKVESISPSVGRASRYVRFTVTRAGQGRGKRAEVGSKSGATLPTFAKWAVRKVAKDLDIVAR